MKKINNYLENQINKLLEYINNNNLGFGFKLYPNRNHKGIYIKGEPFDYIIYTKQKIVCFDTKQTIKDQWNILKKDKNQLINLIKIKRLNTNVNCFIIIYFITKNKLMIIDVENILKIIKTRKHIKFSDCKIWNWKDEFNV